MKFVRIPNRHSILQLLLYSLLTAGLASCAFTRVNERNPYFDKEAYCATPPRTLAVAPVTNRTDDAEAAKIMRTALFSAFAPLGYSDVELKKVDDFVGSKAMTLRIPPDELNPWHVADPKLADAVVFAELENVSRFYLLIYSHVRIDLSLIVADSHTKKYLYRSWFVVHNRQFSVPLSPFSIADSLFSSLWHMRREEVQNSMDQTAKAVAGRFQAAVSENLSDSLRVAKVEVIAPRKVLREGEKVVIRVQAAPGRTMTFSLGQLFARGALHETTPGNFEAEYVVKKGDDTRYVYATIFWDNPTRPGDKMSFAADDQAFGIDTTPPPPFEIVSLIRQPGRKGITLRFAPERAPEKEEQWEKVKFHVFRADAPGAPLKWIGDCHQPEYDDTMAQAGIGYDYAVTAEDEAGNISPGAKRVSITP